MPMSRHLALMAAIIAATAAAPLPAMAQRVYGPVDPEGAAPVQTPIDTEVPITSANACETQPQGEGEILVCAELPESERYLSPIPREVRSDRREIPGLTDPPCWVSHPELVGTPACMRMGWAPPPAIMVDVTAFPEDLTEEEKARVFEAEEGAEIARPAVGERVAIDLSEDEG